MTSSTISGVHLARVIDGRRRISCILFPSYSLVPYAIASSRRRISGWREGFLIARIGERKKKRERRKRGKKDPRSAVLMQAEKGRGELSRAVVCRSRVGKASLCRGITSQAWDDERLCSDSLIGRYRWYIFDLSSTFSPYLRERPRKMRYERGPGE